MFDRFTDRAKRVMGLAREEAQRFNHEYLGTEHILLGLVQEGSGVAANVLKQMGIDLDKIRVEVEKIVKTGPSMVTMGQLPFTPRAKKVLELSLDEASNLGHNYIGTEHLLLGLIRESEGIAARVLTNLGVKLEDVHEEVLEFLGVDSSEEEEEDSSIAGAPDTRRPVSELGRDLTELARVGRLDSPVGVDDSIRRVIQILGRHDTRSAALLGPSGIGKHSVVEGVARRLADRSVSQVLRGRLLLEIDVGALLTTKQPKRAIFESLREEARRSNLLLYVRDFDRVIEDAEAYHAFREALLSERFQFLLTATQEGFESRAAQDPSLDRCFERVVLSPPPPAMAVQVLRGVRDRLESHHHATLSDESLSLAVELSGLYLPDRPLPERALSLLDEAGAVASMRSAEPPPDLRDLEAKVEELDRQKDQAVTDQDFERAAQLRDAAYELRKTKDMLLEQWRNEEHDALLEVESRDLCEALARMTGIAPTDIDARRNLPRARTPFGTSSVAEGVSRHERSLIQSVLPDDEIVIQRGRAFVVIPHRPHFETLFELSIAPALTAHGLEPIKGNDIAEPGGILPQVWRELRSAEIVVAVLTGRNPNVIYELGLCHGIRRCPILLVEKPEDLPFNLLTLRHVQYEDSEPGREELRKELTALVGAVLELARSV